MNFSNGGPDHPWSEGRIDPPRGSVLKPVLVGCGVLILLAGAVVVGCIVWIVNMPESGVKMANEMDEYAMKRISEQKILNDSEKLVAYYDDTISMSGTEAAILTTERVIYYKEGRVTAIPLRDVADVQHHYVSLTGDVIEVVARSGERMKIEIAPQNDGEAFLNALNDARRQAGSGAPPDRGSPRAPVH